MRRGFLVLLVMAAMATLTGCATYSKGYFGSILLGTDSGLRHDTLPPQPPAIIRGQVLQYYGSTPGFDEILMAKWQATGLFASVVRTPQASAPATGSYLSCTCHKSRDTRTSHGVIGGFLWLSSAGMFITSIGEEAHYCTTELYQNGVQLGRWGTAYSYELMNNSWLFWLMINERKVIQRTRDNVTNGMVATAVHDLKARFP